MLPHFEAPSKVFALGWPARFFEVALTPCPEGRLVLASQPSLHHERQFPHQIVVRSLTAADAPVVAICETLI